MAHIAVPGFSTTMIKCYTVAAYDNVASGHSKGGKSVVMR
jgi:hypothetical protein